MSAYNKEVLAVILQSAVCLDAHGGVYSLRYEPTERGLERNMHMDMQFHCRETGVRIMPGMLLQVLQQLRNRVVPSASYNAQLLIGTSSCSAS